MPPPSGGGGGAGGAGGVDPPPPSRFAHLLQPIRDVAANWAVDVAAELEAYLDDIDAAEAALSATDFTTAALLVQGSAGVYARKVGGEGGSRTPPRAPAPLPRDPATGRGRPGCRPPASKGARARPCRLAGGVTWMM